jgi:hypothetical protein
MPDFTKIAIIDLSNPHDSVVSKFARVPIGALGSYIRTGIVSHFSDLILNSYGL